MTKAQREAQDSQVYRLRAQGKGIRDIMAATGQSYARVQAILALAEGAS